MVIDAIFDVLCLLVVISCLSLGFGGVVFGPLREAARERRLPLQFRLTDMVLLLVQLQVFVGLLLLLSEPAGVEERSTLTTLATLQISIWWLDGIRMASHAGVSRLRDRLWFVGLLVPLGYLASAALVLAFAGLLAIPVLIVDGLNSPQNYILAMAILSLILIYLAVLWGFRLLCGTLAARSAKAIN